MNELGFRLGSAAVSVLIGLTLTAVADVSLDIIEDVLGLALKRGVEVMLPPALFHQYGYAFAVGFFSALSGTFIANNAN